MLKFYSGNVRTANTERAVKECFEKAFKNNGKPNDIRAVIVYTTLGHKLDKINDIVKKEFPEASVVAASCGGVVGADSLGESMHDIGLLVVSGPLDEIDVKSVDNVTSENSYEKMKELSESLHGDPEKTSAVMITIPGFDCAMDEVVEGFSSVFSDKTHLTGGVSSDNMKAVTSYQLHDGKLSEHMIWAVSFSDPTLACVSRATHGFDVIGDPMEITDVDDMEITEFDGKPASAVYANLHKITEGEATDMMPFGAMAEKIPEEYWKEYGSEYRLNGLVKVEKESLVYRTHFDIGTVLRLAVRNEKKIFSEMERIIKEMAEEINGDILAVSHSDCIARGRFSFNEIKKEELIGIIQDNLADNGKTTPWLGMYGFGEFCQLGGKNFHHTFTTSLTAIYRKK